MTESDTAAQIAEVVDRYIAVWNEPDADAQCQAIAELWTDDGTYTDPLAAAEGRRTIEAVIAGTREQFPGYVFKLIDNIDAHHDIARFAWELVPPGGGESGWSASTLRSSRATGASATCTGSSARSQKPDVSPEPPERSFQ